MAYLPALFLLSSSLPQDAKEVTQDWKHPWAGATVGTWLKFRITRYESIPTPGGDTEYEEKKSDRTDTVTKVSKASVEIRSKEGEDDGTRLLVYTGLPGELGYKMTRAGEEDVKVGDQTYKCAVYEFRTGPVTKGKKDGGQLLKVWKAPGTLVWAVKQRFWLDASKDDGWTEEWIGTETVKLGGREYTCATVKRTNSMGAGGMSIQKTETTWQNSEIPGWTVKRIERNLMNGKENKMMDHDLELVEFEKK